MVEERKERRWVVGIALLLMAAVSAPYAVADRRTPPGFVWSGILLFAGDTNQHLTWMRQASDGHFFFQNLYTTEPLTQNIPSRFSTVGFWAMGALAGLIRMPLIWMYHLTRVVFAGLAIWWFYRLLCVIEQDRRTRLVALLLAAFSCGGGWLTEVAPKTLYGVQMIDRVNGSRIIPEAFTFSSALLFPQMIASIALLALLYRLVLTAQQSRRWRWLIAACIVAIFLGNIHTYDSPPLMIVLAIWAILCWRGWGVGVGPWRWAAPAAIMVAAAVPIGVQSWIYLQDPTFRAQALLPTTPPGVLDLAISLGLLGPLALFGAVVTWRRGGPGRLMVVWVAVGLAAVYVPVPSARKMIEGAHLPLCFLAAVTVGERMRGISAAGRAGLAKWAAAAAVAVCCLSTPFLVQDMVGRRNPRHAVEVPFDLSEGDAAALRYLAAQPRADRQRAVLCSPELGSYVPAHSGFPVYVGHWAQTMNYWLKAGRARDAFAGRMSAEGLRQLMADNKIGYVVEGLFECEFERQGVTLPSKLLHLGAPVFQKAGTAVYKVPAEGADGR